MNHNLTDEQVNFFQTNGYVIVEDFLDSDELDHWRSVVDTAIAGRAGQRFGTQTSLTDEIEADADYQQFYDKVFTQMVNLWQDNPPVRDLMHDERIGEMISRLGGFDTVRVWHDQALVKEPYANPTAFHLDSPYWSFTSREAISIWVALDDATEANGCLYFFPGSHLDTTLENVKLGPNVDAIFEFYPQFAKRPADSAAMKAGSCSFHSGMTIHGAGANMTAGLRRAMTASYMPDGMTFNGQASILSDEQVANLEIGQPLDDPAQNPIIFPV